MSTKSTGEAEASSPKPKGGEESEEESDVLEESPCGRWQKRREEVVRCTRLLDAGLYDVSMSAK